MSTRHPGHVTLEPYLWNRDQPDAVPGIAVKTKRGFIVAHLTPDEARTVADQLHDLSDQIEQEA